MPALVVEQPYDAEGPPNKSEQAPTQEKTGGLLPHGGPEFTE